jgi:hypothetical protein
LEDKKMETKQKTIRFMAILLVLVGLMVLPIIIGAGDLEPSGPPGPTMKTLDEISAQITALSSPIKQVVRGVITLPYDANGEAVESPGDLSSAVDPNYCVVLLSDSVASDHSSSDSGEWTARTGACLMGLTETQITVRVEGLRTVQKVSYQIIEYK